MSDLNCRAELYRQENDATMAIVNYSQVTDYTMIFVLVSWRIWILLAILSNWVIVFQAIKLNPNDAETYYQRAAMFKMVT